MLHVPIPITPIVPIIVPIKAFGVSHKQYQFTSQLTFTCSKSTEETLRKGVKYVKS